MLVTWIFIVMATLSITITPLGPSRFVVDNTNANESLVGSVAGFIAFFLGINTQYPLAWGVAILCFVSAIWLYVEAFNKTEKET
jgi:hypothetical protein